MDKKVIVVILACQEILYMFYHLKYVEIWVIRARQVFRASADQGVMKACLVSLEAPGPQAAQAAPISVKVPLEIMAAKVSPAPLGSLVPEAAPASWVSQAWSGSRGSRAAMALQGNQVSQGRLASKVILVMPRDSLGHQAAKERKEIVVWMEIVFLSDRPEIGAAMASRAPAVKMDFAETRGELANLGSPG